MYFVGKTKTGKPDIPSAESQALDVSLTLIWQVLTSCGLSHVRPLRDKQLTVPLTYFIVHDLTSYACVTPGRRYVCRQPITWLFL